MRSLFAKEITSLAKVNKNIVLLSGDIGNRMFDNFKDFAPDRFINCGIAEANMMSMAAGMSLCGLRPFIYTITPFTTTRCLEQIKIGVAYHNSDVVIVGTGSGLSYAELGPTHHSLEDIAIIRSIPDIRILAPADPQELKSQLLETLSLKGPTYIRIGKKGEPNLFDQKHQLGIGKSNLICEGNDYIIFCIGPITNEAVIASNELKRNGISLAVVSMSSIRPLDEPFLKSILKKDYKKWITLEEHGLIGGLGSTILEWISDNNYNKKVDLKRFGAPDKFIHKLGNQSYVRKQLKLNAKNIIDYIKEQ
jgi:transketolase